MQLVTGASGFIGQHLVKLLSEKGQEVRALYHKREPDDELKQLPGVNWMQCDLLDIYAVEEALKGINDIYHCAAIVSFSGKDKERILHCNVESTANIVNIALEQGIRKIIYLSSVAALGRSEQTKEITEEEQWEESRYNSVYAQSKHMAELEVWRGIGEGLDAIIVNPGIVLGEGDWKTGSSRLMKTACEEFPFYTQGITSWVDVKDVVRAMYLLMESDITAERFILSEGNHAFKDVFTWMAEALHKKPPHIRASPFMTGLVWRWSMFKAMFSGKPSVITKETARTAQKKSIYNNSKLLKYFKDFNYTPLRQTIERMAVVFKKENE